MPFFSISGSDFVEMFVGVGASRVRDLFEQAKENAPAIVFIDEIDAVGRHRGAGMGGGHDEREQTLNQLLVEMDGFDVRGGVILIAATNRPDVLDPALLRPGRFDRQIAVDAPDLKGRFADPQGARRGQADGARTSTSKASPGGRPGFTGADLANVLNEAALLTARQNARMITKDYLDEAIDRVIAGPQKRSRLMNEREKLITAYHEGGHALVAAALPGTDPVQKVTILPRGRALGYTMVLPEQDKYSNTRAELLDQLAYMMGGRAAEELVFHDPTTGASNDIEKATNVARAMVTQYGMTERLGRDQARLRRRRAVPGPRHRPRAGLLRGRRRDRRRGGLQADQQRPPGGLRHPHREPGRARRPGPGAVREGDPGPRRGGRGLPAAAAVAEAARLDRLGRPGAVGAAAGHPAAAGGERPRTAQRSPTGSTPPAGGAPSRPVARRCRPGTAGSCRRQLPGPASPVRADCRRRARLPVTDRGGRRPAVDVDRASAPPVGEFDHDRIVAAVREILIGIGEDPDRDGLRDTPERVARAYAEMFQGLRQNPEDVLATVFDLGHDEFVLVKDIEVWSCCEHHLVPFTGVAHVGYIPNADGRITGLSKLARLVDLYAKRPQVQERLTTQVADALERILEPRGVIVVIECEHLCMTMRGVRKPGSKTVTSAVRGQLRDPATRAEAMSLIVARS